MERAHETETRMRPNHPRTKTAGRALTFNDRPRGPRLSRRMRYARFRVIVWWSVFVAASWLTRGGVRAAEPAMLGEIERVGEGVTPGIATDADGTLHLVTMHDGTILYRRKPVGGKFGAVEQLPLPEGKAPYNSPHVVCDAGGVVHLVFARDVTGSSRKAWYTNRRDGAWKPPLLAIEAAPGKRVNYPRLALAEGTALVSAFVGGASVVVQLVGLEAVPSVGRRIDTPLWVAHAFPRDGGVWVVGRAGAAGHKLERYDSAWTRQGEALLLSRDTPTKTGEPTAAVADGDGTIFVVGLTGHPVQRLWGTTEPRATAGASVILGPEVGRDVKERTFPVMAIDRGGRVYVSYRDHGTGEGRVTVFDAAVGRFSEPLAVAPSTTARLRWNPHLAAAREGGVHVAWDDGGQVFTRVARVPVAR
jgi:hypothetical protein